MPSKHLFLYTLLLLTLLTACQHTPEPMTDVVACAPMPEARASAIGFSINGKGYILGGRKSDGTYAKTLFCYDPATNQWTDCGETPLCTRVKGIAAVQGEKVYIGLGYTGGQKTDSKSYPKDWWEYTPTSNTWRRCADYPSPRTDSPMAMADDQHIFVGWGMAYQQHMTSEIYAYAPQSDQWTLLQEGGSTHPAHVQAAAGAACHGRYFAGTGHRHNSRDTWFEMIPTNEQLEWKRCASLPYGGRCLSTATAAGQYVYLFGGRTFGGTLTDGRVYQDILRYDTQSDKWAYVAALPNSEAENMVSLTIGDRLYFGGGNDKNNQVLDGWYSIHVLP